MAAKELKEFTLEEVAQVCPVVGLETVSAETLGGLVAQQAR
jgi:hypothetical protein